MSTNSKFGKVDIDMIKMIMNNLGWKIVSIIAAFFLWLLVVNYEDPIINRDFDNVPVAKLNASAITAQNKAIEYQEGEAVDVTVRGKRSIIDRLTKNDIRAFVDLSKVSITGAIDIEIEVDEGIQVMDKRPGDMKIALENIISVQKEVQYYFDGEPSPDFVALDPIITPSIIQITGPESQVNLVSNVMVPISIRGISKDITLFATPQALDSDKNVVSTVTTNVDRVEISVPVSKKKTIPIIFEQIDDVAVGYRLTDIQMDVNEVTIMGKEEILNTIEALTINNISLRGMTDDITVSVNLEDLLSNENVEIISGESIANVTIDIDRLEEKNISVDPNDIEINDISDGFTASIVTQTPITATFRGTQVDLNYLSVVTIDPYISLEDYSVGTYDVTLNYIIPNKVELISAPAAVKVVITQE